MKSTILQRGFLSLIITQFFGAMNDNLLKGLLIFMVVEGQPWSDVLGKGGEGIVAALFTLPFVLLSGYAGDFADRNSKRLVSVWVKVVEIPIAITAGVGFWMGSCWTALAALVALACQSAFFGPAKYGMIPELVSERDLSRANGTINMMTNIAVIVGTLLSGIVADRYAPMPPAGAPIGAGAPVLPPAVLWLPAVCFVLIAGAGLASVVFMPRLAPGDPDLPIRWNPLSTYIAAIRDMGRGPMLWVMLAWGYFYLIAGMALLIIPNYATILAISREEAARLLGVLGVSIGVGSAVAGFASGNRIRPILVPIGGVGLTVACALLGLVPPTFGNVAAFIFLAGFFAGFYIIPLQALMQYLAPGDERGRFLGTANGVSFAFLTVAGGLYAGLRQILASPEDVFLACAALMAIGLGAFMFILRGTGLARGIVTHDDT